MDQATTRTLDSELPDEVIFNLGPMRFVAEVWRVLKPGAYILDGIQHWEGWPAAVKLPHHTGTRVQYSHLRQAVRWLGFQEAVSVAATILQIKPDTKVLCTGAAYHSALLQGTRTTFCREAYTNLSSRDAGRRPPETQGCHYHDIARSGMVQPHRLQGLTPWKNQGSHSPIYFEQRAVSLVFPTVISTGRALSASPVPRKRTRW